MIRALLALTPFGAAFGVRSGIHACAVRPRPPLLVQSTELLATVRVSRYVGESNRFTARFDDSRLPGAHPLGPPSAFAPASCLFSPFPTTAIPIPLSATLQVAILAMLFRMAMLINLAIG